MIVDSQIVDEIFFMVPSILNVHERFLDELKKRLDCWDSSQKVGDAYFDVVSNESLRFDFLLLICISLVFKTTSIRNVHIICE